MGRGREPSPAAQPGAQPGSPAREPSTAPTRPAATAQRLVISVPGVNDTPRSTSPNPAARMVLKLSAGGVTAASFSGAATSLFGEAPWAPPPPAAGLFPGG